MRIMLYAPSRLQLSRDLRKFKKEHRKVKVLKKGVDTVEHGYKCKYTRYYWATVHYED